MLMRWRRTTPTQELAEATQVALLEMRRAVKELISSAAAHKAAADETVHEAEAMKEDGGQS